MIKKLFAALLLVLFMTTAMAQSGLTCYDPIPVDSTYEAYIDGPCELWYTAGTYDLPLKAYFLPDANTGAARPSVYIDFTCEEGVYEDEKLDYVINSAAGLGYSLPLEMRFTDAGSDGRIAYSLEVLKFYRDQLIECGIDYNVPAVVRVKYFEAGVVTFTPDTAFKECMGSPNLILGQTIDIQANDSHSVYIAPLPSWKHDSIRFVWEGAQPVQMYWANTSCEFNPTSTNPYVYQSFEIKQGTPLKMYSEDTKAHMEASKDGGIYFVKFVAPTSGRLTVEKIPAAPAAGGASVLEYDKPETVKSSDATKLYAFSKTWDQATIFNANAKFEMQVSNSHTFDNSVSGVFVLSYASKNIDGVQSVGLSSTEMLTLTSNARDHYIYVRFVVNNTTIIVPRVWNVSECIDITTAIEPNVALTASSSAKMYRLLYSDFTGADVEIVWEGTSTLEVNILNTCSVDNSEVLHDAAFPRKGSIVIPKETVDSWANKVDADGYLYVNFIPKRSGRVTFKIEKPAEQEKPDPVYSAFKATVCYGETYTWNDKTYNKSGYYTQNFVAVNGADSIVVLQLTVLPEHKPEVTEKTIEYGETYEWNGKTYTETTTDTVALKDENDCDYIAILRLTVLPKPEAVTTNFSATVCYGETYTWNGQTYGETGNHTQSFVAVNGADSIVTLQLTVLPEHKPETTEATIEYGETYEWNGKTYTETTTDTVVLKDNNGCEYLAILKLTVNAPQPVYTSFADTVCFGETYTWNGYKYTETKEYTQTFKATNGADSIVTLKLTVLPEHKPEVTEKTIEYGETYEWNGKTYDASDKYTITLEDENGCEYQATLILTVNPKPEVPCELSTIELKVGDQLVLNLDSAFTIYTIDYDAWLSTGATLVWTGEEPLHTFAAEQCEFAVAPYNKYVIEYFAIPAKGMVVIDSSILSSMAGRVDAGGYLYIRFLTEKEGVLEVK